MAKNPAGFVARVMCALAAASLIAAPMIVNADAGAPHKVHKKSYKKSYKKAPGRKYKGKRKRSAGALPRSQVITTTTPAPPPPPPPPPPPFPPLP